MIPQLAVRNPQVSNPRKRTPSYLPHKQTGRARAVWTDQTGVRHDKLLPGPFDTRAANTASGRRAARRP